jgi:hypothetical protein
VRLGALFTARLPDLSVVDATQAAQVMAALLERNQDTAQENFAVHVVSSAQHGEGWAMRLAAQAVMLMLD